MDCGALGRHLIAAGLMTLVLPCFAFAQNEEASAGRLLVFDFEANTPDDQLLAESAQRFMVSELSEMGGYAIIQKADMLQLLKLTEQRQQLGCADSSCASEYSKLLDAKFYLRGDLARLGGKAVLTLQLFSVRKGQIETQRTVTLRNIDTLAGQMRSEAYALMGREAPKPRAAWYAQPLTWVLVSAGVGAIAAGFYALNQEPDPVTLEPEILSPPDGPLGTVTFGLSTNAGGVVWRW